MIKVRSKKGAKVAKEDRKFFQEIWNEREHVSEASGIFLGDDYNPCFFAHILSKAAFPKFRHYKKNIALIAWVEHRAYDDGRDFPGRELIEARKEELKEEYSKFYNK